MKNFWTEITSESQFVDVLNNDSVAIKVFFKHSTRCSISSMALKMFENEIFISDKIGYYFIDLIAHREVSNLLTQTTNIEHQSPQVIVLKNGKVIYSTSHHNIDALQINKMIENV
jgi:bacillithiol system protein YtxJ